MNSAILLLVLVVCLIIATVRVADAQCPPVADSCPLGVAETDPVGTAPKVCSGKGQCLFGACKCDSGFGDVDCAVTLRKTKLASVFLSQAGLNDGPTRYFDIITQVVELLRTEGNFSIPPQEIINQCTNIILKTPPVPLLDVDLTLLENSITVQILDGGIRTGGTAHMKIPKVPLDAAISRLQFITSCCDSQNKPLQASSVGCSVQCASSKDFVSFEMDATFSADIFLSFTPDGDVTVNVPENRILVSFNPPNMGFKLTCDLGALGNFGVQFIDRFIIEIGRIVASQVLVKVREIAGEFANSFSLSGTKLNLTDDISVQAFVPFMEFKAGSHIAVDVEGIFQKNRFFNKSGCPSVVTTFVDRTVDASLPVPSAILDAFWQADDNQLLQTLFGMRLARSAMTVGVNVLMLDQVQLIDTLTSLRVNFGLLDASFTGALDVDLPQFGFPAKSDRSQLGDGDFLEAGLSGGEASLICNQTGQPLFAASFGRAAINLRPLILGDLEDFQAAALGADANFRVTLQVFDLDVTKLNFSLAAPINVSVPNALMVAVTDTLVGGSKMDAANELLKDFALPVPPELTALAPGPRVESIHDTSVPGTDGKNGFFQISTRCLCGIATPNDPNNVEDLFFVVESKKFGKEIVPRCITACSSTSASSEKSEAPAVRATDYYRELNDRRRLQQTTGEPNATDFVASGDCGPDANTLKLATKAILTCAQRLDVASLARDSGRLNCMKEVAAVLGGNTQFFVTGACDAGNTAFAQFNACPAPVRILTQDLFGQTCLEGPAFSCNDTLAQVFADTCFCATNPADPACSTTLGPGLVLAAGWAIPLSFLLISLVILRFFEGCCVKSFNEEEKIVSFFRVQLSKQDKYFLGLASLAVFAVIALTLGWAMEDPFLVFLSVILEQDVFKKIQWVTTNFDDFVVGWSLSIMFSFAFAGSCYLSMIFYSLLIGRCAWLNAGPNAAYMRNGEWFIPSQQTLAVWTRNAKRLQWLNRISVLLIVTCVFAPPIFFPVRKSVVVAPPQFDVFNDQSNADAQDQLLANLTTLATSQNALDLLGEGLGFTLMSSFLGFLSSVVLLILQGAVPAAFCAASLALYWTDAVQRRDLEEFQRSQAAAKGILPPPDNSDKDRWRRSLHFFVWCVHSSGAFGSLVAAILLYQTLRAPVAWAIIYIVSWVVTLPGVFLLSKTRHRTTEEAKLMSGKRRLIIAVLYTVAFFGFTITLVALAPQKVSFASPLAVVLFVAVYLYVFILLLSEYCNLGTYTLSNKAQARQSLAAGTPMSGNSSFEVGYALPMNGGGMSKSQGRVKSVVAVKKQGGSGAYPSQQPQLWARASTMLPVTFEEHEVSDWSGSQNPAFAGSFGGADQQAYLPSGQQQARMMFAPPAPPSFASPPASWAPPVFMPSDPRFPDPMSAIREQHERFQTQNMDPDSLRRATERVSMRYGNEKASYRGGAGGGMGSAAFNNELRNRISSRLQFRGVDPKVQQEMAERIATFAANGGAAAQMVPPTPPQWGPLASPASSVSFSSSFSNAPKQYNLNSNVKGSRFSLAAANEVGEGARQVLKDAVARTRQSVSRWGEEPSYYQQQIAPVAEDPSQTPKEYGKVGKVFCDNRLMDILFERTERKENTYGLRVVPFRRLFFVFGLILLLSLLINSMVNPISVQSIKKLVFNALISLLVSQDPNVVNPELTAALDFQDFDALSAPINPPLQAYVDLTRISFFFLWIVFGLFFISLALELYYSRLGKSLEQKRRGIKRARLFSFAHLPFLFIAVVVPSSADYVSLSLGGLSGTVPLCAEQFDQLVFSFASNLFGLAMGGLLAVQTMVILLLIVPAVQRALAFVVAREIYDLKRYAENSKTFFVAEKRIKIARFLWRAVPFMSPVLLYVPTILIAQLVAQVYSSILVYAFYTLPLITARLRTNKESRDQKPYRWILFSTIWTGLYFVPLGLIGLVEIVNLDQVGFLADLLLQNPIFFVTILAEVSLAVVVISDVLYLFISSDDENEADTMIDLYIDAVQKEAGNNDMPTSGNGRRPPFLPPGGV